MANDYEKSKLAAERLVRSDKHLEAFRIFRPSIITGEHRTGHSSTFHGFYAPLRIGYALLSMIPFEELFQVDFLALLGLTGQERKNLVPVDWVSDAMVTLLGRQPPGNETFALVSPQAVTVGRILRVFAEVVRRRGRPAAPARKADGGSADRRDDRRGGATEFAGREVFQKAYVEQFAAYRSYWRDEPQFDCTATLAALPDKPCPPMSDEVLTRLCEYAIDARFGWPRKLALPLKFSVGEWLRRRLRADTFEGNLPPDGDAQRRQTLGLTVTGSGGGCWTILGDARGGLFCREGRAPAESEVRMNARTFQDLVEGGTTLEQTLRQARVMVRGDRSGLAALRALVSGRSPSCGEELRSQATYGNGAGRRQTHDH